jgi:hypothetical protein
MVLLYGRAGCLTAKNGGFWPEQIETACTVTATPLGARDPLRV